MSHATTPARRRDGVGGVVECRRCIQYLYVSRQRDAAAHAQVIFTRPRSRRQACGRRHAWMQPSRVGPLCFLANVTPNAPLDSGLRIWRSKYDSQFQSLRPAALVPHVASTYVFRMVSTQRLLSRRPREKVTLKTHTPPEYTGLVWTSFIAVVLRLRGRS